LVDFARSPCSWDDDWRLGCRHRPARRLTGRCEPYVMWHEGFSPMTSYFALITIYSSCDETRLADRRFSPKQELPSSSRRLCVAAWGFWRHHLDRCRSRGPWRVGRLCTRAWQHAARRSGFLGPSWDLFGWLLSGTLSVPVSSKGCSRGTGRHPRALRSGPISVYPLLIRLDLDLTNTTRLKMSVLMQISWQLFAYRTRPRHP